MRGFVYCVKMRDMGETHMIVWQASESRALTSPRRGGSWGREAQTVG